MSPLDYKLLARLLLLELDQATVEQLVADARFRSAMPSDLQQARVEFMRLFSMGVFPYASVFLDAQPELNGESSASVEQFYARAGFKLEPQWVVGAPDAIGAELACLARLLESGRREMAVEFFSEYVLGWAPVCCLAVERNARLDFYRRLARVTRESIQADVEHLGDFPMPSLQPAEPEGPELGLAEVVGLLISPARCGMFLSKDELRRIAEKIDIPIGFGDRELMTSGLFREAAAQERLPRLISSLENLIQEWAEQYDAWSRGYPRSSSVWQSWRERTQIAQGILQEMMRMTYNKPYD